MQNLEVRLNILQTDKPKKLASHNEQGLGLKSKSLAFNSIPRRTILTQCNDTFAEKKIELDLFKFEAKPAPNSKLTSREKRRKLFDFRRQGADVGKYTPKYTATDQQTLAGTFSGGIPFN